MRGKEETEVTRKAPLPLRSAAERPRPSARVNRLEAAQILNCSRDNVRRMDKDGQLKSSKKDRYGVFHYDRREIEEIATRRGLNITTAGELTATVFALFKARTPFQDVCIATKQEPETIQRLWERFRGGYDYGTKKQEETAEAVRQREHEEQMRTSERELAKRRRDLWGDEEPTDDDSGTRLADHRREM